MEDLVKDQGHGIITGIKEEQLIVIVQYMSGRDVFVTQQTLSAIMNIDLYTCKTPLQAPATGPNGCYVMLTAACCTSLLLIN